jgi:hypothetical protein
VVVTGGSKCVGRGIASVFAEAGANVAVAVRSAADIDAAVPALDGVGDGKAIGVTAWSHYGASKVAPLGFMRTAARACTAPDHRQRRNARQHSHRRPGRLG